MVALGVWLASAASLQGPPRHQGRQRWSWLRCNAPLSQSSFVVCPQICIQGTAIQHTSLVARSAGPKSYGPDEYYSTLARKEGVPARSYYKLQEMDRRLRLFRKGMKVLDLGCWPGSWTLYAARHIGRTGRVMGVDLKKVTFPLPDNAKTIVQNAFQLSTSSMPKLDVVISDMAPKTMGDFRADSGRSARYVELTMQVADMKLAAGGTMIAKMFDGADTKTLLQQLKLRYETGRIMRLQATRSQSNEIYLVGIGKRSNRVELPTKWRVAASPSPPPPQPHNFNGW